ncbi:hypothetical protein BJY04DRAFT_19169 [Aspergillus karnatakaensis]|uniref:uncharacterized protein n=1 Tax=Aspergillus karnatakaensis TaxID=1810916 RepID=UPI003CCD8A2E
MCLRLASSIPLVSLAPEIFTRSQKSGLQRTVRISELFHTISVLIGWALGVRMRAGPSSTYVPAAQALLFSGLGGNWWQLATMEKAFDEK